MVCPSVRDRDNKKEKTFFRHPADKLKYHTGKRPGRAEKCGVEGPRIALLRILAVPPSIECQIGIF